MKTIYDELYELQKSEKHCVMVTVVDKTGEGPQVIGSKMLVSPQGWTRGTVGGGNLEAVAYKKAMELFTTRKSFLGKFDLSANHIFPDGQNVGMICGGMITLFFDYIRNGTPAYVFGAGHVGRAIIRLLANLDYSITAVDNREGIFEGFDPSISTVTADYAEAMKSLHMPDGSYIVIATSGHTNDFTVLKGIYESKCSPAYIGLLSSKAKVKEAVERLREAFGRDIGLSNLYTPAGLDIGGPTPDEIAVSIVAEMQSIKYGRQGNLHMRETWYL